jgi:hypothetical protein
MNKEKLLAAWTIVLTSLFYSNVVWAAEDVAFKVSIWPFVLLGAVLFLLRKKIIAESTVPASESKAHSTEKATKPQSETKTATTADVATSASDEITDLTQHVEQCQGTTAKGTRCRRTTNLEPIVVNVENKKYRFLTCKQHNNEGFVPFHFR